jgi:hypothetical protein
VSVSREVSLRSGEVAGDSVVSAVSVRLVSVYKVPLRSEKSLSTRKPVNYVGRTINNDFVCTASVYEVPL